jgi:hypothetical protein
VQKDGRNGAIVARMGWKLLVAIGIAGIAAAGAQAAAPPKYAVEVRYKVNFEATETTALHVDGTWQNGGCNIHGTGDGKETVAFTLAKPEIAVATDNGKLKRQYVVGIDTRQISAVQGTVNRAGALKLDVTKADGSDPALCTSAPTSVDAPATGCGSSKGVAKPGTQALNIFGTSGFDDKQRRAPGRTVPITTMAAPAPTSLQWGFFPWLQKLEPCPSSITSIAYTLPRPWSYVGGFDMAGLAIGGTDPASTSGNDKPLLPPGFWAKASFGVPVSYSWTYNVVVGSVTVGKETHTVTGTARFKRSFQR